MGKKALRFPARATIAMAMTPGKKLLAWRKKKGLTQQSAAALIGANQATWCEWEADRKLPRVEHAFGIQRVTRGAVKAHEWVREPSTPSAPSAA